MKDFIKKIQNGSEANKMRWLILFSAIAIIVVIFFWLKYFNSMITSQLSSQNLPGQEQMQAQQQNSGQEFSFWQTFKTGLGVISQGIADGFHYVINVITQPKNYIVKP